MTAFDCLFIRGQPRIVFYQFQSFHRAVFKEERHDCRSALMAPPCRLKQADCRAWLRGISVPESQSTFVLFLHAKVIKKPIYETLGAETLCKDTRMIDIGLCHFLLLGILMEFLGWGWYAFRP